MRFLLLILAACLALGAAPAPKSDAAIEEDIRARLGRSKIASDGFQVRVQGGVATLTGKTDVVQHKGVATRLARLGGATRVVNNIQVGQKAREKAANRISHARRPAPAAAPPPAPAAEAPPPIRRARVKH